MIWDRIIKWFRNLSDRRGLINDWNVNARQSYIEGVMPILLEASVSMGNGGFKHELSSWLHTGFRIKSSISYSLKKEEILEIGRVILINRMLVRQLIVLGFDTLEVYDESTRKGAQWALKEFRDLQLNK